jgi:hypothetical protein
MARDSRRGAEAQRLSAFLPMVDLKTGFAQRGLPSRRFRIPV